MNTVHFLCILHSAYLLLMEHTCATGDMRSYCRLHRTPIYSILNFESKTYQKKHIQWTDNGNSSYDITFKCSLRIVIPKSYKTPMNKNNDIMIFFCACISECKYSNWHARFNCGNLQLTWISVGHFYFVISAYPAKQWVPKLSRLPWSHETKRAADVMTAAWLHKHTFRLPITDFIWGTQVTVCIILCWFRR